MRRAQQIVAVVGSLTIQPTPGLQAFTATISVGVASTEGCTSVDELYRLADESLYAAKRGGRDQVGPSPTRLSPRATTC